MKKILMAMALCLAFGGSEAQAAGKTPTYEVGYSSFRVVGVVCTTGTIVNLVGTRPANFNYNVAGYLIQNQDSADAVYIGDSSLDAADGSGYWLSAGADFPLHLDKKKDPSTNPTRAEVYCEAAAAAGAAAVQMVVVWFGY